ncbi:MAG: class I SAM-dependent methyltransferase [Anaerolineales bacterium]|jgi:SAM-dependent methyltransferase
MIWNRHPWELIYAQDGRVFLESFPGFDHVVRMFKENGCQRILDLGCGSGRHAVSLAKQGFSVLGADISLTGLKLAHEWAAQEMAKLQLAQADFRMGLPFASSGFDGVFSTQVIHHAKLGQIRSTIAEIQRILQPSGFAFITVSARKDQGGPFEEIEPSTYVPQTGSEAGLPHHIFTEDDLRHEFRTFDILEISLRADGKVLAVWARKP